MRTNSEHYRAYKARKRDGLQTVQQQLREFFAEALIEAFTDQVLAEAHQVGGCWPTGREAQAAVQRVGGLASEVAQD
ncbi:hypothetical protein [Rhodoferax sp.]|uniref:hypothetical protein n=1 Tax=Rhodoferax sp. TaxID=50421 RepID=UPI002ACDB409|nr:hypothetical protein [Rhodoferax sp.]MDZ7921133.1 hypothetical protein [Rhodoferax sp.]